jgi:hypothetical protein
MANLSYWNGKGKVILKYVVYPVHEEKIELVEKRVYATDRSNHEEINLSKDVVHGPSKEVGQGATIVKHLMVRVSEANCLAP